MAHMDAASRGGGTRRARHAGMFVPAARPPMCPCPPAAPFLFAAAGMPRHGAGDSIIPSAIPDSHRAAAAIAPGGFPFRSR